jgi:hypothetical protein
MASCRRSQVNAVLGGSRNMDSHDEHWVAYAEAFAQPLQANGLVSRFVANGNVTGAYAEAWIRAMAKNMLGQRFRVSTGAVIRSSDRTRGLSRVAQCDLIVWDPSEMPGIFECGDFALVPLAAVRALIEVKRSVSTPDELAAQLKERSRLVPSRSVLGIVVSHGQSLRDFECTPDWLKNQGTRSPMTRLLDLHGQPDTNGVMAFIYFLAQVAGHSRTVVVG